MTANLTPDIRKQLEINGWGVSQNDPKQNKIDFVNFNNKNATDTDSEILALKARKETATKEEKLQIDNDISIKEKEAQEYRNKAKNGSPTDGDNTQMYASNLFNHISNGYVKDDIVDSDLNDSNLKIAQYYNDKAYKEENLKLKKESNKIAKTANDIATGLEVDAKDKIGETKKPTDEVEDISVQKREALKNSFIANDPEFVKLSADKQWEYIDARLKIDKPIDVTTDKSSIQLQEDIRKFKEFHDPYLANKKEALLSISQGFNTMYDKLLGSKDIGNLAESSPHLYEALKSGKSISQVEKEFGRNEGLIIRHELATDQLQTGSMTEEERALLIKYTNTIESQKSLSSNYKKQMQNKSKEAVSFYNNGLGDLALGFIKGIGNEVSYRTALGFNNLLGRSDVKNTEDYNKNNPVKDALGVYSQNNYYNGDLNPFQGNTNISEIQNRNIIAKKKDGKDMSEIFTGVIGISSIKYTDSSKKLIPKIYDSRALAFSDKSDYAKLITTVVSAQEGEPVKLETGSAIKASMIEGTDNIEITYTPKKLKSDDPNLPLVRKVVKAEFLKDLAIKLQTDITPIGYSRKNLDAPNKKMIVSTPKETTDVFNFIKNLHNTYGEGLIPSQAINGILSDNSIMSQSQFNNVAEKKSPEIANKIKAISANVYGVEWANRGGVWVGTVKKQDGSELIIDTQKIQIQLDGDYNEGIARLMASKLVSDAKTTQISELIK